MTETQLLIADHALNVFHLAIVAMLLFGWISRKTRRLHRWTVGITAFCWTVVAELMGKKLGYCPVTDWHWQIKRLRAQDDMPPSYIAYQFQQIGLNFDPVKVDYAAIGVFILIIVITLGLWARELIAARKSSAAQPQ